MRSFTLAGHTITGDKARVAKDVALFTDAKCIFSITIADASSIKLTTVKGKYTMQKHAVLNYYYGICNGRKVQVHLKAVSGWLKFW